MKIPGYQVQVINTCTILQKFTLATHKQFSMILFKIFRTILKFK